MTTILFPFDDYPAIGKKGKPALFEGVAEIKLIGTFPSPVVILSERSRGGSLISVERPLQTRTRWTIEKMTLIGIDPMGRDDVFRWFEGKFWYKVPRLLYVQWLRDRGFDERAEIHARIAA